MKMEPIVSSETSAIKSQTPGNYPKRNKLHLQHGESLKRRFNWNVRREEDLLNCDRRILLKFYLVFRGYDGTMAQTRHKDTKAQSRN